MDTSVLMIFMVLALAGLIWANRNARKRQRAAMEFRENLQPGTRVMTASGMFGTVISTFEERVVLEDETGGRSEWLKVAIARVDADENEENSAPDGGTQAAATAGVNELGASADSRIDATQPSGLLTPDEIKKLGRDN